MDTSDNKYYIPIIIGLSGELATHLESVIADSDDYEIDLTDGDEVELGIYKCAVFKDTVNNNGVLMGMVLVDDTNSTVLSDWDMLYVWAEYSDETPMLNESFNFVTDDTTYPELLTFTPAEQTDENT